MSATFQAAVDEMLELFRSAWASTGYQIVWPNKRHEKPSTVAPWARVFVRHVLGGQATLSNADGVRRWRRQGFLTIQVFVPSAQGLPPALALAKIAADAYEGSSTPSGVWFRNVRLNEVGPDGDWFQVNVIADFEYDEVK